MPTVRQRLLNPAKHRLNCILRSVSAPGKMAISERNRRKSLTWLRNIPVFGRFCAETCFDLHCATVVAVTFKSPASRFWAAAPHQSGVCDVCQSLPVSRRKADHSGGRSDVALGPLPDSCITIRLFSGASAPRARRRCGGIEERLKDVISLADQHHLGRRRIGVG